MTKYNTEKTSLAVVSVKHPKDGVVLWAAGQINDEIDADGYDADALGLLEGTVPETGIWVWEGRFRDVTDDFGTCSLPKGRFRAPTDAEWAKIQKNESPWNDGLWFKANLLQMC
jgi:hypothetical protein